jgi:hypothetical protein
MTNSMFQTSKGLDVESRRPGAAPLSVILARMERATGIFAGFGCRLDSTAF